MHTSHCDIMNRTAFDRESNSLTYMISLHEKFSISKEKGYPDIVRPTFPIRPHNANVLPGKKSKGGEKNKIT